VNYSLNNYDISIDITPKNKYEKAEKELLQALKSFSELNFEEQKQLAIKLFGIAQVDFAIKIFQQYNMR
jgi:hypothetical protein